MKFPNRSILPVLGYAALLALLVVPMYILRDYPWWFLVPLGLIILRIAYDAVHYCLRVVRSAAEESSSDRSE